MEFLRKQRAMRTDMTHANQTISSCLESSASHSLKLLQAFIASEVVQWDGTAEGSTPEYATKTTNPLTTNKNQ